MGTLHWAAHVSHDDPAVFRRLRFVGVARRCGVAAGQDGAQIRLSCKSNSDVRELLRAIVIFPLEMVFIGGIFAGFVWGAYLTISCLLGLHCDQAFASMGIPDFKNFLRMKVEPNKLTIYPIGLRRTPRRWGWRRAKDRGFGDASGPAIVPTRPLRPSLIEGPIEIRVGDLKRPNTKTAGIVGDRLRHKRGRGSQRAAGTGNVRRMQARLSMPASKLKAHYDVIVVGSGYGAGVAASRLARCGRKVAVLERGREFLPGDFPEAWRSASAETQMTGPHGRVGSATALFDVRVGKDVNVLMACGLGGTSLINANVCLSPDARVFEDTAWPREVRRDRLLAEGFVRARHMLRPEASRNTSSYEKVAALRIAASAFERQREAHPAARRLRERAQRRRRPPGSLHRVRRLLRRLQRRRQDDDALDLHRRRGGLRRRGVHRHPRAVAVARRAARLARVGDADRRRHAARAQVFHHRRHRRAGGRHARLDRDPAALAGRGAGALRLARQPLHLERRRHRARLQQRRAGQRHRRRPAAQGAGAAGRPGRQRAHRPARYQGCARRPRHVRVRAAERLRLGAAGAAGAGRGRLRRARGALARRQAGSHGARHRQPASRAPTRAPCTTPRRSSPSATTPATA